MVLRKAKSLDCRSTGGTVRYHTVTMNPVLPVVRSTTVQYYSLHREYSTHSLHRTYCRSVESPLRTGTCKYIVKYMNFNSIYKYIVKYMNYIDIFS